MDNTDPSPGIKHLFENALPLIGRVGAIAGGILSLVAALRTITNEIVIAVEGVALVSAVVSSAFVVWSRTTRRVDEKSIRVPHYSRKNRFIAGFVFSISALLLLGFVYRVGGDLLSHERENQISAIRTPRAQLTPPNERTRPSGLIATIVAPASLTSTPTPGQPTATVPPPTFTAIPLNQITDVNTLNKLGTDALAAKNYRAAFGFFSRALQVDATNAPAQLGYGETQFYLGNEFPAQSALRTALQLNPGLVDAHAYLAFVYDQQQDYARARAEYEEFARVAPKDNPLYQQVRERVIQLSGKGSIPTATVVNANLTPSPTASATLTNTATPTITATQTFSPTATVLPSASPTRIATPK